MSVSMFVFLCLSLCAHIFDTARPIFANMCAGYLWSWLVPILVALR